MQLARPDSAAFAGCCVVIRVKVTSMLLDEVRRDLARPHAFARERVGFLKAALALSESDCTILVHSYTPVADNDYLNDPSVGAMMGPHAISMAMAAAFEDHVALLHVHSHSGRGIPNFSGVDLRENQKFVPDFFKVCPQRPHGAVVLSATHAYGHVWLGPGASVCPIDQFQLVGPHYQKWGKV